MIVVNPATRQFNIPGSDLVFGVTADANSAVKHFQCPRYVGNNVDIVSSFVRINYQNPNGEIDFYLVKDVTVDGDNVTFDWELHPKVTMYKGNVSFVMCVTGPDTKVKWHTTLGRGQVLEGLEPDNALVESETSDGIAALIAMVEAQTEAVEKVGADQVVVVKSAAKTAQDSTVAEIEAKRVNSLASIPADYTALSATVDTIARTVAPGIVCSAEGDVITLRDASDNYLRGLRIFGRSTQDGIPTPENPVEIVSVGDGGSISVNSVGKNRIPYPYPYIKQSVYESHGITYTVNGDGSILVNGTATDASSLHLFAGGTIVPFPPGLVRVSSGIGINAEVLVQADIYVNGVFLRTIQTSDEIYEKFLVDTNFDVRRVGLRVTAGSTVRNVLLRPMLYASETAHEYEPYKVQTMIFSSQNGLPGIPVTTGGNYTDANGQQWVCDEVDLERGVYTRRVNRITLNGAESWSYYGNSSGVNQFHTRVQDCYVNNSFVNAMSPQLRGIAQSERNYNFNTIYTAEQSPHNYICVNIEGYTGQTAFAAFLAESPIDVLYRLASPIETPLSETELAAYRALRTNKPNTTILNDSGAYMSVEYTADTKLYIDNLIKNL